MRARWRSSFHLPLMLPLSEIFKPSTTIRTHPVFCFQWRGWRGDVWWRQYLSHFGFAQCKLRQASEAKLWRSVLFCVILSPFLCRFFLQLSFCCSKSGTYKYLPVLFMPIILKLSSIVRTLIACNSLIPKYLVGRCNPDWFSVEILGQLSP